MTSEFQSNKVCNVPFIVNAVRETFNATPDAIAISIVDRDITYAELCETFQLIQDELIKANLERGSLLALHFRERWLMIPAILAAIASGLPFVPLDPGIPLSRLRTLSQSVPLAAIICDLAADGQDIVQSAMPVLAVPIAPKGAPADKPAPDSLRRPMLNPNEFATVYFTSGSTGQPKAIAGRLCGVDAFVQWEIETLGLTRSCRVSQLTSPCFDGFLKDVFVPLCAGGTVCIPHDRDIVIHADELASWLESARIDVLHLVPSLLRQLMEVQGLSDRLKSLKAIVLAGEAVRPSDVRRLMTLFGERVKVLNLYGPTETTLTKLCHIIQPKDATAAIVPIGTPMPGTRVVIASDEGQPCEPGTVGEILIISPYSAIGYLGQSELTHARFLPDPGGSADVAYRTGDLGRLNAEGEFEFVGRIDNQVKIRGVRIEPEELESVFSMHESVVHAAVVPMRNRGGELYLACYCVLQTHVPANDLMEFAAAHLPRYMLPSEIRIVSSLPRTSNGKLDRKAIERAEPARESFAPTSATASPTEVTLTGLFQDVLGVQDVDPRASFFVQGGHSLLAIELLAQVYKALNLKLTIRELFQNPSVSDLATYVDSKIEDRHARLHY